jgi:Ca2+-binding EF-hand superfamily protein
MDAEEKNMDKKRYKEIFKKLDKNGNGKIESKDLIDELGVSEKDAQVCKLAQ